MLYRWEIVNLALRLIEGEKYLEIGCHNGYMLERVEAKEKHAVEPEPFTDIRGGAQVFCGTSDEYFEQLDPSEKFDVIFVDGLHHCDQAFQDVQNALRHLKPGGVVLMHDCIPGDESMQKVPRVQDVWTGDVWKAFFRIAMQNPKLPHAVANTDYGVGALIPPPKKLREDDFSFEGIPWKHLTWEQFKAHHEKSMNVLSPQQFEMWLRRSLA